MSYRPWVPLAYRQPHFSGAAQWWMNSQENRNQQSRSPGAGLVINRLGSQPSLAQDPPDKGRGSDAAGEQLRRQGDRKEHKIAGDMIQSDVVEMTRDEYQFVMSKLAIFDQQVTKLESGTETLVKENAALRQENVKTRAVLDHFMSELPVIVGAVREQTAMESVRAKALEDQLADLRRANHLLAERNADLEKLNRSYTKFITTLQEQNHDNFVKNLELEERVEDLRRMANLEYGWTYEES